MMRLGSRSVANVVFPDVTMLNLPDSMWPGTVTGVRTRDGPALISLRRIFRLCLQPGLHCRQI
jgi:hypothetical protein